MKAKAYFAFVRPTVEYASVIWSPHTTCDITALEVVQRKAAIGLYVMTFRVIQV